jgi:hypothetical protein
VGVQSKQQPTHLCLDPLLSTSLGRRPIGEGGTAEAQPHVLRGLDRSDADA